MEYQIEKFYSSNVENQETIKSKFIGVKFLNENFEKKLIALNADLERKSFMCLIYGSTRMENGTSNSDVDTCFLTINIVSPENFAKIYLKYLEIDSRVENMKNLMHAPIPKLEAKIDGIKFEILLARSGLPSIPKDLLQVQYFTTSSSVFFILKFLLILIIFNLHISYYFLYI